MPGFRSQFHNSIEIDSRIQGVKAQQIVSALERLILTQDTNAKLDNAEHVDPQKDLIVYGDVVEIRGPLVLQEREVQIFARVLTSSADSKNQGASIDVSGAAPPSAEKGLNGRAKLSPASAGETATAVMGEHSKDEKPGGDGAGGTKGDGGNRGKLGNHSANISLSCTEADPKLSLTLIARGGAAQDGQAGQPGQDGQDGGAGAPGTIGDPLGMGIGLQFGTKGGKGGNGGDGGPGGEGGHGGNGGTISIGFVKGYRSEMIRTDVRRGEMGKAGSPGKGGELGSGGKSGSDFELIGHYSQFGPGYSEWKKRTMQDGARGDRSGNTPQPTVNPANQAHDGRLLDGPFEPHQMAERALPAHCTMLMHRLRNGFLSADPVENPEAFRTTAELAAWIESLTSYWTTMPQTVPTNQQFSAIHSQCASLMKRLQLGLTYYGHARSYAPRASLSFYQGSLEKACRNLEALEKDAMAYLEALEKHTEAAGKLRDANDKADGQITALGTKLTNVTARLESLAGTMRAAHNKVIAQEKVVTEKLQEVAADIQEKEGLTVTKLATVVSAWTLPKEKGALDILKFTAGVVKDVKGIYDEEKETQYKIHRMSQFREGMKLKAAYEESEGALTLADPNGYKVLASRKRLDEALKGCKDLMKSDAATAALDLLIELSDERNQLVVDYNGLLSQIAEIKAQTAEAKQQRDNVEAQLQKNSRPDLPEFAAWVGDLYDKARSSVIEQVYLASRAYSWWALEEFPIYTRLGLKSASTVTAGILKAAQGELLNAFRIAVERRAKALSPFPSVEARKVNPAARGAVVTIDHNNFRRAFEELRATGETTLELPATLPYKKPAPLRPPGESGSMKAFALLSEVMIRKVRVYLRGVKSNDAAFAIKIIHGGVNQVVRRDGAEFVFTSVPVDLTFKYRQNAGATEITFDGDITEEKRDGVYAPLSPFGWWRISIDQISHPIVDLSGLTAAEIEFHGDADSFPD